MATAISRIFPIIFKAFSDTELATAPALLWLLQSFAALEIEDSEGEEGDRYQYKDQVSHGKSPTVPKFTVRVLRKG